MTTPPPTHTAPCPHCGRLMPPHALAGHLRPCSRWPSESQLRADLDAGAIITAADAAARYRVSNSFAYARFKELDIRSQYLRAAPLTRTDSRSCRGRHGRPSPQQWRDLAAAALELAVRDVRQIRHPERQQDALLFLKSPRADLWLDALGIDQTAALEALS